MRNLRILGMLLILWPLSVFASNGPLHMILGLEVNDMNPELAPALFTLEANDSMSTWKYHKNIDLPNIIDANKMFCPDNTCIVGANSYNENTSKAILLLTNDKGASWRLKDVSPPNIINSEISDIYCNEKSCIAIGSYELDHIETPFFITSSDQFQTWKQESHIEGFDKIKKFHDNPFTCTQDYCVMAGANSDPISESDCDNDKPIFLFSDENKQNWHMSKLAPTDDITSDELIFKSISCSGNTCIAGGESYDKNFYEGNYDDGYESQMKAVLYVTHDKGHTWSNAHFENTGQGIVSVKCNENTCIAAGMKALYVSHDQAHSWNKVTLSDNGMRFNAIDYTKLSWLASEVDKEYDNTDGSKHLVLKVSHDRGDTWSTVKDIQLADSNSATDGKFSCNSEGCMYLISKVKASGLKQEPFLLTSDALGVSWQTNSIITDLPESHNAFIALDAVNRL